MAERTDNGPGGARIIGPIKAIDSFTDPLLSVVKAFIINHQLTSSQYAQDLMSPEIGDGGESGRRWISKARYFCQNLVLLEYKNPLLFVDITRATQKALDEFEYFTSEFLSSQFAMTICIRYGKTRQVHQIVEWLFLANKTSVGFDDVKS